MEKHKTIQEGGVAAIAARVAASMGPKLQGMARTGLKQRLAKDSQRFARNPVGQNAPRSGSPQNASPVDTIVSSPSPTPPTVVDGSGPAPVVMSAGLNNAFVVLYQVMVMIALLIFLSMIVLGVKDVVVYYLEEAKQRKKKLQKSQVFNAESTDVQALAYLKTSSIEDEPYNIYLVQKLVGALFVIGGVIITMMGLQFGSFLALKVYAIVKNKVFQDTVSIPPKMVAAICIILVTAFALTILYRTVFVKKVQEDMRRVRNQMWSIRNFIYNNLSDSPTFLASMRSNNIQDMESILRNTLQSKDPKLCHDITKPCDKDVEKMLFSFSLYSFMRMQVPETDPNYSKVQSIFTPEGIQTRAVDPTMYFYNKQVLYVPNMYTKMRERLVPYFGQPTHKKPPKHFEPDTVREKIFFNNMNNKLRELNEKLATILVIDEGKKKMRNYLWSFLANVTLFGVLMFAIFIPELAVYVQKFREMWRGAMPPPPMGAAVPPAAPAPTPAPLPAPANAAAQPPL